MKAQDLQLIVATLPARQPITDEFEGRHLPRRSWSSLQKQHLIGWLGEYDTTGFYNRKNPGQDARYAYTHFQCAPGLLWLAEALGEEQDKLRAAVAAIEAAGTKGAAQCGAFRRVIPWERIEELLAQRTSTSGT